MSKYRANEETTSLEELQSNYRTINASLQAAKRKGSKADIRELTRARSRISDKINTAKANQQSQHAAY